MKIFSTLLIATLALVVVLAASASAATVGGGTAASMPNGPDEFSQAWSECLETRDANSDACYRAQELSGMGPDEFFDKLMRKFDLLNEQPKPEKRPDAWALMKECAATRNLDSDACRRWIDVTGLSGDEVAHLAAGLAAPQATADKKSSELSDAMKECAELRYAMAKGKGNLAELVDRINAVCPKALSDSRIAPSLFWKFTLQ